MIKSLRNIIWPQGTVSDKWGSKNQFLGAFTLLVSFPLEHVLKVIQWEAATKGVECGHLKRKRFQNCLTFPWPIRSQVQGASIKQINKHGGQCTSEKCSC